MADCMLMSKAGLTHTNLRIFRELLSHTDIQMVDHRLMLKGDPNLGRIGN